MSEESLKKLGNKYADHLALENLIHKIRSLRCEAMLKFYGATNACASKEAQIRHDAYHLAAETLAELDINLSIYSKKHTDAINEK